MPVYKVHSGRNEKLVVGRSFDDARKKSGYKNPDQVDLVSKRLNEKLKQKLKKYKK